jgi:Kef-type K+ transport system membrane component KefB
MTTTFFVPVFFVYSGLNTRIGLLSSPALWGLALLILAIAIAGKGLACTAARAPRASRGATRSRSACS